MHGADAALIEPGVGHAPAACARGLVDVEFSVALRNRTGKYFIGRDILADQADLIGDVHYWRRRAATIPTGIAARLLGRGLHVEQQLRGRGVLGWLPRLRPGRRMLHLDPFTVLHTVLRPDDLVLCHDLGPLTHPNLFAADVRSRYRAAFDRVAAVAPGLVFVSEASRHAFAAIYGAPRRSRVVHPAIRIEVGDDDGEPLAGLDGPFLLTVGSVGQRKNQARSILAFARSGLAAQGWRYVICGGSEPGADAVAALAERTAGVRLLPYVSDGELAWLYGHARGFVLASLLEGFGMPVAEAIARGLVPLVSQRSVLHEVAGDGALLVDPHDTGAIAEGMRGLAGLDEGERGDRLAMLAVAIRRFSREAFAQGWRAALTDCRE